MLSPKTFPRSLLMCLLSLFAANQLKWLSMNNLRARLTFFNLGQSGPIKPNRVILQSIMPASLSPRYHTILLGIRRIISGLMIGVDSGPVTKCSAGVALWVLATSRRQASRASPGGTPGEPAGEDSRATLSTALSRFALARILHFAFCILHLSLAPPMMHPVIYG